MKTAILVINLGTSYDTETISVRRYLIEFLGDGRVVDINAVLRYIFVNIIIAPIRGFKSGGEKIQLVPSLNSDYYLVDVVKEIIYKNRLYK